MNKLKINGIYKHYKGNKYKVLGIWVRPIEMWSEEVQVDGKTVLRFELTEEK